ncbi:SEL1-like repeat protein [Campylobacter coli]
MGNLYHDGQGVRKNLSSAKEYYGKACDLGFQKGCNEYKILNEKGIR